MSHVAARTGRFIVPLVAALVAASFSTAQADVQTGQVLIKAVQGDASYSMGDTWRPLKPTTTLTRGAVIKTSADATVDLVLQYNGTVLRLTPNSTLSLDNLKEETAGEEVITETSLNLLAGSLVGSQRKLAAPSIFKVKMPGGTVTIKGTEYLVRADGAVSCISGSVQVVYNLPNNGGAVTVTVPAGYSFDPTTGQVVPTTSAYLQNIIADIDTVRQNAEVFKAGASTVVVRPEPAMSPVRGGNNGVGNGFDPQPPGNPPINDGPGTGPGNPGNQGGTPGKGHK